MGAKFTEKFKPGFRKEVANKIADLLDSGCSVRDIRVKLKNSVKGNEAVVDAHFEDFLQEARRELSIRPMPPVNAQRREAIAKYERVYEELVDENPSAAVAALTQSVKLRGLIDTPVTDQDEHQDVFSGMSTEELLKVIGK